MKLHKKVKLKLNVKITFSIIILIINSSTAIGIASIFAQYQALIDDTGKRLTSLAYYAASHINGDDLTAITNTASEQTDNYSRVQIKFLFHKLLRYSGYRVKVPEPILRQYMHIL